MLNEQELKQFIKLFSETTKIPQRELKEFIKEEENIVNLLKRPQMFTTDPKKLEKIIKFNELRELIQVGLNINPNSISSPQNVYDHLIKYANVTDKEYFIAIFLNNKNKIIKTEVINIGNHNTSIVDVKDIVKKTALYDSTQVIISHNHPSGIPRPSEDDKRVTRQIDSALKLIGVKLLDHIILGDRQYYSFKENDQMQNLKSLQDIISEEKHNYKNTKSKKKKKNQNLGL